MSKHEGVQANSSPLRCDNVVIPDLYTSHTSPQHKPPRPVQGTAQFPHNCSTRSTRKRSAETSRLLVSYTTRELTKSQGFLAILLSHTRYKYIESILSELQVWNASRSNRRTQETSIEASNKFRVPQEGHNLQVQKPQSRMQKQPKRRKN